MDLAKTTQWRESGAINFEAEQRIVEAEGGTYPDAVKLRRREALLYFGGLLVISGGLALAFDLSTFDFSADGNGAAGVLVAVLVSMVLAGTAAYNDSDDPVARRANGFLAAAAVFGAAVAAGILFFVSINPSNGSLLLMGVITAGAGYGAWRWLPSAPTQVALHIGLWLVVFGLLIVVGADSGNLELLGFTGLSVMSGVMFLALGCGWLALTHTGYIVPKTTGYVLGIITAATGTQILSSTNEAAVIFQLALGIALLAYGVTESRSVVIFFGGSIAATGVLTLISSLTEETRGAAVAATGLGILALLLAILKKDDGTWLVAPPTLEPVDEPPEPFGP